MVELIWISICNTIVLTLIPHGNDNCESNIANRRGVGTTMRRAKRNFKKPKKQKQQQTKKYPWKW